MGSMGIPREIVQIRKDQNFLFQSENKNGPGDYNPTDSLQRKLSPVMSFGKPLNEGYSPSQNVSPKNQWQAKLEKYVDLKNHGSGGSRMNLTDIVERKKRIAESLITFDQQK